MTAKDYCSKVCGAKCCRAHSDVVSPAACPMLSPKNLCLIYRTRLGFRFKAVKNTGEEFTCRCSPVATFLPTLPAEIRAQCCYEHPELLNEPLANHADLV